MVTDGHNIASGILLKGISKGPLGAGLASMDIGSAKFVFPRHFPNKDRLTSSRPDTIVPMKLVPRTYPRYLLRSTGGCRGNREHSAPATATPPTSKVRHPIVSSFHNKGTSILWRSNTVKTPGPRASSNPPSSSTVICVAIFLKPQVKSPTIPFR
eukprot:540797-Pelagomonas_calceolata.AAC.1